MNQAEIIQKIAGEVALAAKGGIYNRSLYEETPVESHVHEFLFFVKPEVTLLGTRDLSAVLSMMFGKIAGFGLAVQEMRILTAGYMETHNIIARHYGVINAMSRQPLREMGSDAREKFRESYGLPAGEADVMGSLQFLEVFSEYNPETLNQLWQGCETVKLAGGTYCARIRVNSKEVYLINGFHPKQLIHFTEPGRCILAFTLTGNIEWSDARNRFIGKTNPADAAPGSLRNELLQRRAEFGMDAVSASLNGFHLSAGPVEGLVELIRYCSDLSAGESKKPTDFLFGKQLAEFLPAAGIEQLLSNPVLNYRDKAVSIFDLTEEKNSEAALKLLQEVDLR